MSHAIFECSFLQWKKDQGQMHALPLHNTKFNSLPCLLKKKQKKNALIIQETSSS